MIRSNLHFMSTRYLDCQGGESPTKQGSGIWGNTVSVQCDTNRVKVQKYISKEPTLLAPSRIRLKALAQAGFSILFSWGLPKTVVYSLYIQNTWWRHDMEILDPLLALFRQLTGHHWMPLTKRQQNGTSIFSLILNSTISWIKVDLLVIWDVMTGRACF